MQGYVCPSERSPILLTECLILRHWRKSDREPFARVNSDPRVMEVMPHALSSQESDLLADRIEAFSTAWLRLVRRGTSTKWQLSKPGGNDGWSGFCTVPDHSLTPGKMHPSFACISNNDRPRTVTDSEKKAILATYGYSTSTKESTGEFDHWLPHWMGGADTQENI
jgi:hypothetical protein